MGNCCCTVPSTLPETHKKEKRRRWRFSLFSSDEKNRETERCTITVLKDPTGDDLHRQYELGKELGRGEFGITHLCTDRISGKLFACKSISKKKLRTSVDVEDVRREVEIMRQLPPHDNIVKLKETYEDDESVYIVMELCEGGELFDRIVSRGHYTERAAASVTRTIVEVVQVPNPNPNPNPRPNSNSTLNSSTADLSQAWGDSPGFKTGEFLICKQEGDVSSEGHRLWLVRLLLPRFVTLKP